MKKQISGGAVLSFVAQGISVVIGLLYTPVMIKILGQNEYGLYQLVQSVVNYLSLMNFGFSAAYIRYYSLAKSNKDEEEIANINGMFLKIFLMISLLSMLGGGILFANIRILGTHLTDADYVIARELLIIMVINLAVSFPSSLFTAYLSANERFIFQKLIGILANILVPAITVPLLLYGYGSVGVVSVTLFLTIMRLVCSIWYCVKKLSIRINIRHTDRKIFENLLEYTFFIFLSDVVDQLNTNVDKFLLGRLIGAVSVAIYSVGFSLRQYYLIASWIIPEIYIPETNRVTIEEKDDAKLQALFVKTGRYNNYICLLILSGFFLVGRQFIQLWVGAGYENSYYICIILMIAGYVPAVQTLGVNIQNAKNMHRTRSVVYFVIACINVVLSILLIKRWGEIGTAIGTLIAVLIGNGIFMNYYYYKFIKLDIFSFWKEMLKWIAPASALFVLAHFVVRQLCIDSWLKIAAFAMVYSFAYLVLLWCIGIGEQDKTKIRQGIKKAIKRIEA